MRAGGSARGPCLAPRRSPARDPAMDFEDYRRHDAVGLAELVARREVSGEELLETAAARRAEVNPKINAVVQDLTGLARGHTNEPGAFSGVPFLLKDLGVAL